jgi:hypothetical protein
MKPMRIILVLLGLTAISGCEKDVREPGEPRVQFLAPQTSTATFSSADASGLAYLSPNK